MRSRSPFTLLIAFFLFISGFASHLLYVRWTSDQVALDNSPNPEIPSTTPDEGALQSYRVTFLPLAAPVEKAPDLPVLAARDVDQIRGLAGNPARIRGRVFKVGHAAKSNTYFLNFGPSREALTAVIFASAVELFEKKQLPPTGFDGKEVEVHGTVKDHPQYGLEVILESPAQIRIVQ